MIVINFTAILTAIVLSVVSIELWRVNDPNAAWNQILKEYQHSPKKTLVKILLPFTYRECSR